MYDPVIRHRTANVNLLEYANKNRHPGFFSHVTIVTGSQRIPAHRLVLCCYSTYLEKYFNFLLKKSQNESVFEIKNAQSWTALF